MIDSFSGKNEFLSNFYPSPILYCDKEYATAEHLYQSLKTTVEAEKEQVRLARTPGRAKRAGAKVTLRLDWEEVKIDAMRLVVGLKFGQHPKLLQFLLDTDLHRIAEGNYWHDNFWGDCGCKKCADVMGKNWLGIILMEVRMRALKMRKNEHS